MEIKTTASIDDFRVLEVFVFLLGKCVVADRNDIRFNQSPLTCAAHKRPVELSASRAKHHS
ncbi:MAG: hypothetical protein ABSC50_04900 [Candidatus Bathyarchaeia archaeon]